MAYIIDGHNLIGILPDIHLHEPDDESRLLDRLRSYRAHRGGLDIIVFFDSGPTGGGGSRPRTASTPGLDVRYSAVGQSADDAIAAFLRTARQPGQYAVVTNDQELAARSRALGASVLPANDFVRQFQRRPQTPPHRTATENTGPQPHDPAFADLFDEFLAAEKKSKTARQQLADAPIWIERLYTADAQLAERAAQWLGENGGDTAVEPLQDALTHKDAGVRAAAALALGALRRRKSVPDLCRRLLEDGNSMVREAAAQALGLIGDRNALPSLETAAVNDSKGKVRKAASAALTRTRARSS